MHVTLGARHRMPGKRLRSQRGAAQPPELCCSLTEPLFRQAQQQQEGPGPEEVSILLPTVRSLVNKPFQSSIPSSGTLGVHSEFTCPFTSPPESDPVPQSTVLFPRHILSGTNTVSFFFFFFFFFGCTCSTQRFMGQESNPHHSSNQSHSSDNSRSLQC